MAKEYRSDSLENLLYWREQLLHVSTRRPSLYKASRRVIQRVREVTVHLNWSEEMQNKAEMYAILHEIGKYLRLGRGSRVYENIPNELQWPLAAQLWKERLASLHAPSEDIDAIIAYCELTTDTQGDTVELKLREQRIEKQYGEKHPQRIAYSQRVPLAENVAKQLGKRGQRLTL